MAEPSDLQIPPPVDAAAFERHMRDLFEAEWGARAEMHGRTGQPQCGVDVYGQPHGRKDYHGVQCKLHDANVSAVVTESELSAEVEKAREFRPAIKHFTLATTAPRDVKVQAIARRLSVRADAPFPVDVMFWDDIVDLYDKHPKVFEQHYPEFHGKGRQRGPQGTASASGPVQSPVIGAAGKVEIHYHTTGAPREDARPAATEPAPAPVTDPLHQLPSPPADFTGREGELRRLMQDGGGAMISGLRGMGGIGKTALALVMAQKLIGEYPDAQVFLDLRGTSETPLTAADAMSHVIHAFQPEARLPESIPELLPIYRSVLHGKKALILMDNAAGREQVEALIPPPGCGLIITSRNRFSIAGLTAIDLDRLPEADACKLLLKLCERIGNHAAALARACGCLPLALRMAAGALAERVDISAKDYVGRLADEKTRLKQLPEVEASLRLSDELLPAELRKLWHALGVFPGEFDACAAGAVWNIRAEETDEAIGGLMRRSLLEWNDEHKRYRLHDLVRAYAANRLAGDAQRVLRERHARHYLAVLRQADELYLKGGENIVKGLALFDAERQNIDAGQSFAGSLAESDDDAATMASEYPDAGTYVLDLRQHPRERIRWLNSALSAARRLKDRAGEGVHLGNLGLAYAALGETRKAIEFHEQYLAIAREIGDRRGEGQALGNLGLAYADLGETRKAIEFYEQRLAIAREIGDRRGEGAVLGNLGNAYYVLGEMRKAIEFYEQAMAIDREIGDRRGEGQDLGNLGIAYDDLGDTRKAIELCEQRLGIAREIGDRRGEAADLFNWALALQKLSRPSEAIPLAEEALRIYREIEDPNAAKAEKLLAELRTQAGAR